MKYLPFENITYKTKLDPEEVLERINRVIEPKKTFSMTGLLGSTDHKPYEGVVNGKSFKLVRIIGYRNSFLPRIEGIVENDFDGSKIYVKMRLHSFVLVFILIWFGGVGMICLALINSFSESQNFEPGTLIPFGMLIFGYALVTGGFKYESIKSKKYLGQLFEAEIE